MSSQAIKEYDDFAGQDGYVIIDGLNDQTPGGKKLLSEISGISESDLIGALEGISPCFDNENTVLQGGDSAGTRHPISLRFDNTLTTVDDTAKPQGTSKILSVKNPVPSTTNANNGDVLTYSDTDGIVWYAPQGGGGGSKSIVVVENPTIIDGILTITTQNNTIYDVVTPNGGYTDIKIIPPTVASGEVIDFYVNLQNNRDDGDTHYIEVENMQRITDDFENGIYSQLQDAAPVFIHCFYKYFTLKSISSE